MGLEFSSVLIFSLVCLASASPVIMQARDSNPGCQKASFGDLTWTIANLELHSSSSHHDSKESIAFTLANPALTYTGSCSASANEHGSFSGDVPYPCVFPGISTSTSATFLFNEATGLLNITQAWVCSDQDPRYPVSIHAIGSASLELKCDDAVGHVAKTIKSHRDKAVTCKSDDITVKPYQISAIA